MTKTFKKEMELAKYENLLSIHSEALASVHTDEEAYAEYEMPLEAMGDVVNYLIRRVNTLEEELEEML